MSPHPFPKDRGYEWKSTAGTVMSGLARLPKRSLRARKIERMKPVTAGCPFYKSFCLSFSQRKVLLTELAAHLPYSSPQPYRHWLHELALPMLI